MIFVTHDFGIVAKMCDRVAVMYAGKIVEMGEVRDIFNHPAHPYTEALLASVPKLDEHVDRLYAIEGQPPASHDLPQGLFVCGPLSLRDVSVFGGIPGTVSGRRGPLHQLLEAGMTTSSAGHGSGADDKQVVSRPAA